jgi:hypothetical protein
LLQSHVVIDHYVNRIKHLILMQSELNWDFGGAKLRMQPLILECVQSEMNTMPLLFSYLKNLRLVEKCQTYNVSFLTTTCVWNIFLFDKYLVSYAQDVCRNARRSPCKVVFKTVWGKLKCKWLDSFGKILWHQISWKLFMHANRWRTEWTLKNCMCVTHESFK